MIWLLLLFPLISPLVAKYIFHKQLTWLEIALNIVIVVALTTIVYQLGKYGQTYDTQILNGKVVAKERTHGTYEESYQCRCRTSCSGSGSNRSCTQRCSTCYRTHYTVKWTADTTVGGVTFDSLDRTSRSVYNAPDPAAFTQCQVGEPAAASKPYVNYVKAVPDSLFNKHKDALTQFAGKVPQYPTVHSFYRINRVLSVGSTTSGAFNQQLNDHLNNELRTLGAAKQVNIVVILTNIADPTYRYAVENSWTGGKKNDVVVMIGVDQQQQVVWADVMTFALNTGNEIFHVTLRDSIVALKQLNDPLVLSQTIVADTAKMYDRVEMEKFKYLEDAIEPPTWVVILAALIATIGSGALTWYFTQIDVQFGRRSRW